MSKVFEENAQKAISLSEGLKKHYSEVSRYGVVESELDRLKDDAQAAIARIKEVDAMRLEVSRKLIAANAALGSVNAGRDAATTVMPLLSAALYLGQFLSPLIISPAATAAHTSPYMVGVAIAVLYLIQSFLTRHKQMLPTPPVQ